jgi:hypothetical protein
MLCLLQHAGHTSSHVPTKSAGPCLIAVTASWTVAALPTATRMAVRGWASVSIRFHHISVTQTHIYYILHHLYATSLITESNIRSNPNIILWDSSLSWSAVFLRMFEMTYTHSSRDPSRRSLASGGTLMYSAWRRDPDAKLGFPGLAEPVWRQPVTGHIRDSEFWARRTISESLYSDLTNYLALYLYAWKVVDFVDISSKYHNIYGSVPKRSVLKSMLFRCW